MLKVRHSKARRMLILDFAGDISGGEVAGAVRDISSAIGGMRRGYTLVEVFRGHPHFTKTGAKKAGDLAEACYEGNRILIAVSVRDDERCDPGMTILHRTRWKRHVPEVHTDDIKRAVDIARGEIAEQEEWLTGGV